MPVTGMRRGETVGLRWEDVNLDGECVFVIQQITDVNGRSMVSTPKTKRGQRLVPIDGQTVTMLRDSAKRRTSNGSPGDQRGTKLG
jgi:integrase